jgi:hypothetical protein
MATHTIKSSRWLALMAVVVGTFGMAVLGGEDPDTVEVNSGNRTVQLAEADRHVDQQKDRGSRACKWISVGAPPTPDAVAVLENCEGKWTGNVEWWVPSRSAGAETTAR